MNDYRLYAASDGGYIYTQIPCGEDWTIKKDWNKLDYFNFRSEAGLTLGTHIRFQNGDEILFSGQVMKQTTNSNKIQDYECISYGLVLRSQVSKTFTNKKSSDIIEWIKSKTPTLTWSIGKTTKVHTSLVFENKTLLEIIQNLIWIEWNLGNLIDFRINDHTAVFKMLPGTVEGYTISDALDFSGNVSAENMVTGYTVTYNGKVVRVVNNQYLAAIFGPIYTNTTVSSDAKKYTWTSKEIKHIIIKYAKKFSKLKYNADTPNWETGYLKGESNDYLLSIYLKRYMKANGVGGKIVYYNKAGKRQYSILYKIGTKLYRFPYAKYNFDAGFRDSSKALKGTVWVDW